MGTSNVDAPSILVVDDDEAVRRSIVLNLEHFGYTVQSTSSATEALSILPSSTPDIVLCDLKLEDSNGLVFIEQCRSLAPQSSVVLMTGFGSSDVAVAAIRAGAVDYISKPFTGDDLTLMLRKVHERARLEREPAPAKMNVKPQEGFSQIVAKSPYMLAIFDTIKRLSQFSTTVLLRGESGTGKELLARAIHNNSPRRTRPFVAINCGAIPENLMESELFGHRRGAFTDATRDKTGLFEEAHGGTIFLDEIGELPLQLQVKLLRVLQEQQIQRVGDEKITQIDVRIIAATLRDLEVDVAMKRFRDDLFYRLNVVAIDIPPLRERRDDIPVLVEHFIRKHNKRLGLNVKSISPEALECLINYHWRGNVRELENCIERALVLTDDEGIEFSSLPETIRGSQGQASFNPNEEIDATSLSIKQRTAALEKELIMKALHHTKGNRTRAAKVLEISHRALLYKLKEYGLEDVGKPSG